MSAVVFIGLPCQVMAIKRLQAFVCFIEENYPGSIATWPKQYPPLAGLQWIKDIKLVLGVFCQSGQYHPQLPELLAAHNIDPAVVRAVAIRENEILLDLENGSTAIRLDEKLPVKAMPGCGICSDYTAALADIAIDRKASSSGTTTVIARTELGKNIINRMTEHALIISSDNTGGAEQLIALEGKKQKRSAENAGTHTANLPPAFYTNDAFEIESSIYDSLLQDFYMVKDIVRNDLCVLCGMCETVCPVGAMKLNGRLPAYNNRCSDSICGLCFATCPQTFVMQGVDQHRFFKDLGHYIETSAADILSVKITGAEAQQGRTDDNGVLSAIATFCLQEYSAAEVKLLHHWNTNKIQQNLHGVPYGLLPSYVDKKRRGGVQ